MSNIGKGDEKARLRPTSDRVRESLFNVISHGDYPGLEGARVLDLFAGTGALGLEALSRGALHATFVENGRVGLGLIRDNIRKLGCTPATRIIAKDATRLGPVESEAFDVCFLDPPYGKGLGEKALKVAQNHGWFRPGTLIVLEEGTSVRLPRGVTLHDERRYGDTVVHIGILERR